MAADTNAPVGSSRISGLWPIARDVVMVTGPDARRYLQGQLSQDLTPLVVGASVPTFLLEPTGKVLAWMRVTQRPIGDGDGDGEAFALDVDSGFGDAVVTRLGRFLLRTKATIALLRADGDVFCLAARGEGSLDRLAAISGPGSEHRGSWVVPAGWPGIEGADLFSERPFDVGGSAAEPAEDLEALRIVSRIPAMGAELIPGETIPAEAGSGLIETSVSFTKGCYTGQELVARIDSRANNVPRRVQLLTIGSTRTTIPPVGATLSLPDDPMTDVGTLTSVAWSAADGCTVALGSVRRVASDAATLAVSWPDAPMALTAHLH